MKFSIKKMNPVWVIISYSCIIICGPKMCGLYGLSFLFGLFFIEYWLISIPTFIGVLLLGREVIFPKKYSFSKRLLAVGLMYGGLNAYFLRPGASYNYSTLTELVPQISIGLFVFTSIIFLIATFQRKNQQA